MSRCVRTDVSHRAHAPTMYQLCRCSCRLLGGPFKLYEQQNPKGPAGYGAQYSLTLPITITAGRWSNECAMKCVVCMYRYLSSCFSCMSRRSPRRQKETWSAIGGLTQPSTSTTAQGSNWWTCPSSAPQTSPACACSTTISMATHMQALHSASSLCPWQWESSCEPAFH